MDSDDRQQWGATAFVFVFLALLMLFVFVVGRKPSGEALTRDGGSAQSPGAEQQGRQDGESGGSAAPGEELGTFWDGLAERAPQYTTVQYDCPVDGTALAVPNRIRDNRLGGVASDLMKISLAPPEGGLGQPDLSQQEWELMPVSCPTCGATYMEIDLINLQSGMVPGAEETLAQWDLAAAAPPLADVPPEQWTADEQLFVRYLTHSQAGFPASEQAFAALSAAYAANFSVWYGKDYRVPAPAYYALAAALMRTDVAAGRPERDKERAAIMLTLGELYRLLGRPDDAAQWFGAARDGGELDGPWLDAMAQFEGALGAGDFSLMRVQQEDMPAPPVGWYLDIMLPAINGHISEHRAQWNTLDDPAAIEAAIIERIAERRTT